MRVSVFSALFDYVKDSLWGARSVWSSCVTSIPYLFGVGELSKEVTEQYPDPISSKTADDLPPRSRGLLRNDIEKCTGCRECERQCPTQCIHLESEPAGAENKIWVSVFAIDFSKCIFCGLCAEVCQPQSLVHQKNYEGAVYSLDQMGVNYGRGQVTPEQREKWAVIRKQIEEDRVTL